MKRCLIGFLLLVPFLAGGETLVVSPGGPLPTLVAARDKARAMRRTGTQGPITIRIHAGEYALDQTFLLTPEDSNTTFEAWPGEHPVISGGAIIGGWAKNAGSIWSATVPGWNFRQLFVNGRRAQRARTPNEGYFREDGPSSQDKPYRLKFRGNDVRKEWAGSGAEAVVLLAWAYIRMPIVSVDESAHVATLAGNPRPSNQEVNARYWIENTRDALDAPGEWYLDLKAGVVYYRPLAGEHPPEETFLAPRLLQLVKIDGHPERGAIVRNVKFHGLTFAHADWSLGDKGVADTQAADSIGAAVEAVGAEDCTFEHCQFTHLGDSAIWLGRGSKRNRVVANDMFDIGGGGVRVGETQIRQSEAERTSANVITDNDIHDLGLVHPSAIGVWVAQSSGNLIAHNHIHNLSYSAISVGWTWGYGPSLAGGNIVEYNHLHHIGNGVLSDLGGVYTLGIQNGSAIRNNLIHDVSAFLYGGWGIYPDEGSSGIQIENNVVYNCMSAGLHQHYGRENMVRNNIFAFNHDNQLMRTRLEPHVSLTFERNIVYFDEGRLLGYNWNGEGLRADHNIYWDVRSGPMRFFSWSWDQWRQRGMDVHSMIADPGFANAGNFDFRLRPDSPALKLGFQPIDLSTVGPRVSAGPE